MYRPPCSWNRTLPIAVVLPEQTLQLQDDGASRPNDFAHPQQLLELVVVADRNRLDLKGKAPGGLDSRPVIPGADDASSSTVARIEASEILKPINESERPAPLLQHVERAAAAGVSKHLQRPVGADALVFIHPDYQQEPRNVDKVSFKRPLTLTATQADVVLTPRSSTGDAGISQTRDSVPFTVLPPDHRGRGLGAASAAAAGAEPAGRQRGQPSPGRQACDQDGRRSQAEPEQHRARAQLFP